MDTSIGVSVSAKDGGQWYLLVFIISCHTGRTNKMRSPQSIFSETINNKKQTLKEFI